MTDKEQVIAALKNFTEGADEANIDRLSKAMHKDFLNIQNGYFDKKGVYLINKEDYVEHVSTGKFGGVPREINIHSVDIMEDMAMVKLTLSSEYLHFHSYISLVNEDGWTVIGNFPKVELISLSK